MFFYLHLTASIINEIEAAIIDEEIIDQVAARDFIIDEQNKEIVYLKMQLKTNKTENAK